MLMSLPDENRALPESFARNGATLPGFKSVRRPTASVSDILRRANNLFVVGPLLALGITNEQLKCLSPTITTAEDFQQPNPDFDPRLMLATVPMIAEAAVLLTCPLDRLRAIYRDTRMDLLKDDVFDFMERHTKNEIMELMAPISEEFQAVNNATAVVDSDPSSPFDGEKKEQSQRG